MTDSRERHELRNTFEKTWALAWPVILANLSLPLLSLADAAILGHLPDPVFLAGVTAAGSLMAYVFFGFNFLSMGLSGFTSQAMGREAYSDVLQVLKRYLLVASVLIVLTLFAHPWLIQAGVWLISPPAGVAEQSTLYLQIRMWGVPAIVLNITLLGFFIGMQNTRVSLYSLSLTQLMNIGLNALLVFGFDLATAGIAIGTVISEYLGLLLVLWHLRRTLLELTPKSDPDQSTLSFRWSDYRPIFKVSRHLFIRTFVLLSSFVWFNRLTAEFGELALAANGVLLAFFTLISHFLDGTAAAAEAQTGHAFGEGNPQRLKQIWTVSGILNLGFMGLLSALFWLCGNLFIDVLSEQPAVIAYAEQQLRWVVLLPLSGGLAFWLDGVFIGARRSKDMRNSVVSAFVLFVCLTLLWGHNHSALWVCFNAFFAVRSVWLLTVFYKKLWP
ncbi:MATE family efflux transporter [Reinekea blandensis]|uniref:Na+-driven multidrug efflux pump n=1 Tax=Reinekea blandensis MED297 TaxID=314283 RepID=A4BD66_9GAMM|nr:MATE family efflux transporter [Reinekea blandensis]EAR09810.1 Na+-driven multidrug efflux pump [Reinekea sp. MED297] [Reinekea blandensis MED297]